MWRHRATPLQPEAPRKYWSTNTILCDTINESRAQCQYMMRIRQVSLFEGLRGRRLVLTTNCAKGAQEERRRALQSICPAWTQRCSRARPAEGLHCTRTGDPIHFGPRISTAARLAAVLVDAPRPLRCDAEARRETSARVCSFFRKSKRSR